MSNRRPGNPGLKMTIQVGKTRKTFESIEAVAKAFKVPYNTLYQRIFIMGWSPSKAATTKVRKVKRKAKTKAAKRKKRI